MRNHKNITVSSDSAQSKVKTRNVKKCKCKEKQTKNKLTNMTSQQILPDFLSPLRNKYTRNEVSESEDDFISFHFFK